MRRCAAFAVVVALLALASACGGRAGESTGSGGNGRDGPAGTTGVADGGVAITASNGEVVLPAPATKVVALEWVYAEDLLVLGVTPVGVADVKGYRGYVGAPPALAKDVVDVGTRQEPSLEAIRALDPDLIIGVVMRHDAVLGDLEAIAPTALFDPYGSTEPQLREMRSTFTQIATATGKHAEGEQVLTALDASVAETREAFEGFSDEQRRILVVQPYVANDVPVLRVFTDDSLTGQLFAAAGLVNAWTQPGDEYGFTSTDLEGLTTVTDASVLYTADGDDIAKGGFVGNPLWDGWKPVIAGQLFPLGADAWTYGGPASAQLLLDRVTEQLG